MATPRINVHDRDLLPFVLSLLVPLAICLLVMLVEPGLERSFLYASLRVGAILIVLGLAISFVAGRFFDRGEAADPVERS